jgi:polyhydroxyalkanoate synthesis regulator phasin
MRIENGIYYTEETLTITNIYDVIKAGFEEAKALVQEGKVNGFVAQGFDKKYGWNGNTYYELFNLDYQDLTEFQSAADETETAEENGGAESAVDFESLKTQIDELREQITALKPFADKYIDNEELIDFFEKYRNKNEEKFNEEIGRLKQKLADISVDAHAIIDKIEND